MKRHLRFAILLLGTLVTSIQAPEQKPAGEKPVHLHMFHGTGCSYCDKLQTFLEDITPNHPSLVIHEYEVYGNDDNRTYLQEMAKTYNTTVTGVPMTFVGNDVIIGFSTANGSKLEKIITRCAQEGCDDPADRVKEAAPVQVSSCPDLHTQTLTLSAVICAAAVDAINPCAFAVLTILLATILAGSTPLSALLAGLAFALSIFISYFLMGLGVYSAFAASGISHTLFIILAFLALLLGLFNLKDYLGYKKWFAMEIPQSWRPPLKKILRGITSVPGAFLIGFVVSLFLLPCSSGPYLVILGMLAHTTSRQYAMAMLALYNLIFVTPMILISLAIYFGFTTAEKTEEWRRSRIDLMHLIAGVLLLALSTAMFVSLYLGMV